MRMILSGCLLVQLQQLQYYVGEPLIACSDNDETMALVEISCFTFVICHLLTKRDNCLVMLIITSVKIK